MNSPFAVRPHASRWLTGVALAIILAFAARARFEFPLMPAADSDTWGYLHPALAKLSGSGFVHTGGRNFVYPGWIYLLLAFTGDFRAITVAQHILGLASGGLLWVCWRQWRAWFADPRLPAWVDTLAGLGLVVFFELSASVVSFEHTIRPEAVFPFFALLDLILLLAFLRAWFVERQPRRAALLAGGGLFTAALLCQLKPSFGFALGAAAAPVLLAAWVLWRSCRGGAWLLAGAAGGAVLLATLLFAWPEHHFSQGDKMSTLFLPETLLTVHADLIRDQMAADLRYRASTPYAAALLANAHAMLTAELRAASQPSSRPYPSLGFNPDHLMYGHGSFCAWLNARFDPAETARFAEHYYWRVWMHRPLRMLGKIGRQFGVFYSLHCPAFWPEKVLRVKTLYRRSVAAFKYANYQHDMAQYPPARAYLDAIRPLAHSKAGFRQSKIMIGANVAASVGALPLLGLFGAAWAMTGMAWAGKVHAPALARLFIPGLVLMLFQAFIFGNCLTIAVVHSLSIARYNMNLLVYAAPAAAGSIAWLAEFFLALRVRKPDAPVPVREASPMAVVAD